MDTALNPYAPPASSVGDRSEPNASYPIWNPRAAAAWSLPFGPILGSILYMMNWRALGEERRASHARGWLMVSLTVALAQPSTMLITGRLVSSHLMPLLELCSSAFTWVFFIVWYVAAAREQIDYVDSRFQHGYAKRGWAKPLLLSLVAAIAYGTILSVVFLAVGLR